ncbi:MAG: DUF167 domain-containing protein [Treponema sp.]|nr:DUF167 domain-containing protein [Treponema sp.]
MGDWLRAGGDRLFLDIKALPGASKTEIAGVKDRRLRFRLAAAPEKGKANAELIAFLARTLGCSRRDIAIKTGETSRLKTLAVPALFREQLEKLSKE